MRLRRGLLVLYGLASLLVPVSTRTAPESNPGKLVLATGQEGGTYLRLGHALADVAREDGFEIEVRSSSGSVENIHSLIEGKAQIALVQSDIAHRAWARHSPFEAFSRDQSINLKVIAPLYPETVQILVRPHLYISTTSELGGKSVSLGREGSGTHQTALAVLEASGLSENDLKKALHLSLAEATKQVKEGTIDAMFRTSAVPTPWITQVLGESEVRLIRLERHVIDRLIEGEAYIETSVPRGTYPNQEKFVPTIGVQALLLVRADVNPSIVGKLIEILEYEKSSIEQKAGVALGLLRKTVTPDVRSHAHSGALSYLPGTTEWFDFLGIVVLVSLACLFLFFLYRSRLGQLLVRRKFVGRQIRARVELFLVLAMLLLIWIIGSLGLYVSEGDVNEHFDSYLKSAWSMLVYVAGGFQARVPITRSGEVVAVLATALGVAIIAWVAGEFATRIVKGIIGTIETKVGTIAATLDDLALFLKGEKKMRDLKGHIVIVNWDNRAEKMVSQLHTGTAEERPILVISETGVKFPEDPVFDRGVDEIVGDPTTKRTLARASVQHAHSITILSSWTPGDPFERRKLEPELADAKTITTILAARALTAEVPITAEIKSPKNVESARTAGGNRNIEIVCAEEFGRDVLTQCAMTPGLAALYTDLLTYTPESNEIYSEKVPYHWAETKTFKDVLEYYLEQRRGENPVIPIGVYRHGCLFLNPRDKDNLGHLEPEDHLLLIAYKNPEVA